LLWAQTTVPPKSLGLRHRRSQPAAEACYAGPNGGVEWRLGEWGNTDKGRDILIAVAPYLAAHSPTERAELQTADIAQRLMRGGELHQDTHDDRKRRIG
jgi:hypothetical protein